MRKNSILVVDDDPEMRETLCHLLEEEGYRPFAAADGQAMRRRLAQDDINLILLDLTLERENGLELAIEIRKTSDIPIVMLTAKGGETDRVVGLELGADDYITKPYSSAELLARIKSVLRRSGKVRTTSGAAAPKKEIARFVGWALDFSGRKLVAPGGGEVALTSGEFDLLAAFIRHPDRVMSRVQLLDMIGREGTYDRSIDVQIMRVRKKIGDDPKSPKFIKSIRSVGYIFTATVDWD